MIYIYEGHIRTQVDDGVMTIYDDNTGQSVTIHHSGLARAVAQDINRLAVHIDLVVRELP